MTGNTSKWRAPLAGLASVAMLATMGVAASTANAASGYTVKVYNPDKPYEVATNVYGQPAEYPTFFYGEVLLGENLSNPDNSPQVDLYSKAGDGKIFDYFSYDKAGKEKIGDVVVVKGDTKVFAQYKTAVKVTFDVNNDGTDSAHSADDVIVDVVKGAGVDADDYAASGAEAAAEAEAASRSEKFAGWTYTYTQQGSTDDLYQGEALTKDVVLHARFDKAQNVATVDFRHLGDSTAFDTKYTLTDKAFPEFRAPESANWQAEGTNTKYDFSKPVSNSNAGTNKADLTLVEASSASLQNVTVKYDFNGSSSITKYDDTTTADQKPVKPVDPVKDGAVFTGWYTVKDADGTSNKVDFSKPISEQQGYQANGTLTLYAGWDTTHVAKLTYNLGYHDFTNGGQQVEYVYPGSKHDLPAGLEEYYRTAAQQDAAKGEYTSSKLVGWYYKQNAKDVVTSVASAQNGDVFNAVWSSSYSVRLNGNGGKFGNDTYKWVTGAEDQKLSEILVTPVRSGYTFDHWVVDGTTTKVSTADYVKSYAGATLKAVWKATAKLDVAALHGQFGVKFRNAAADQLTVEAYGYTADSAKAYVDAVYALEDEYQAYKDIQNDPQASVDAAEALAVKYEAAQKLLVKSNGAEVPSGKVAVYRAFNPNAKNAGSHLYTTDFAEYSKLVRLGWTAEGVQFQTTSSKDATPLYRVYNKTNGAHHYTADLNEKNTLVKKGWVYEDVAWYVDAKAPVAVYRAYNPNTGEHVYTTDEAEYQGLTTRHGWDAEKVAFQAWAK